MTEPDLQNLIDEATFDYSIGDSETALAKLAQAAAVAPASFEAWHALAEVNFSLRRFDDALAACRALLVRGPKMILVKHLEYAGKPADQFEMLVVTQDQAWHGRRPLYPFSRHPVGVGDLTSGIFLARWLKGDSVRDAFEHTLAAVDAVLHATHRAGSYELEIVRAQDDIVTPPNRYVAHAV